MFLLLLSGSSEMALANHHLDRPLRGSLKLSVLLCRFSDSPTPSDDIDYYEDFFLDSSGPSLNSFFREISGGAVDLEGSVVRGWYTINKTKQQVSELKPRDKKHTECVAAAITAGYTPPENHSVVVVTSPSIDAFGSLGKAFLGQGMALSLAGHEVSASLTVPKH